MKDWKQCILCSPIRAEELFIPLDELWEGRLSDPRDLPKCGGVYLHFSLGLFTDGHDLQYVGQSKNIRERNRGRNADFYCFIKVEDEVLRNELEAYYILRCAPKMNINIPPNRRFVSLVKYNNFLGDFSREHNGYGMVFFKWRGEIFIDLFDSEGDVVFDCFRFLSIGKYSGTSVRIRKEERFPELTKLAENE